MYMRILVLAVLVFTMTAFAQVAIPPNAAPTPGAVGYGYMGDWFQIKYFPNLGIPSGAYINMSNTGINTAPGVAGNICANVYAFNAAEEMFACCTCLITPDGLKSLNVFTDLVGKALTPSAPSEAVVKLLSTEPLNAAGVPNFNGTACPIIPPTGGPATNAVRGLRAWGTALHALPTSPVTYGITETEFSMAELGAGELSNLETYCSVIQIVGSGYGTCNSCKAAGLGANVQ
jgi:hypothetical protein